MSVFVVYGRLPWWWLWKPWETRMWTGNFASAQRQAKRYLDEDSYQRVLIAEASETHFPGKGVWYWQINTILSDWKKI